MEIIQKYEADEAEICLVYNGNTVYFVDQNDIEHDAPDVGATVRPSQVKEFYLEMPVSELQEAARRSQVHVDPDPDGEMVGSSSEAENDEEDEEEEEEEEEAGPPPDWRPIAEDRFIDAYRSLVNGDDFGILVSLNIYVLLDVGMDQVTVENGSNVQELIDGHGVVIERLNQFQARVDAFNKEVEEFAKEQIEAGHEDLDLQGNSVKAHLNLRRVADNLATAQAAE